MDVLPHLTESLASAGLDLCARFNVDHYNAATPADYALPTLARQGALGLLVGNSRALWGPFVSWLSESPARLDLPHPLDTYVAEAVFSAVMGVGVVAEVRFSHEAHGRRFAAQRLASLSGLAQPSPSGLCIHPTYGPWIALRAALVLEAGAPPDLQPVTSEPCCVCTEECPSRFNAAMSAAGEGIAPHWERWVSVRDA